MISNPASGFFLRRRWLLVPTWRLVLIIAILLGGPITFSFLNAYKWLALTEPIPHTTTLIVEGWLPDEFLRKAANHASETHATHVFCTGIPLDHGSLDLPYMTYADYSASVMVKLGIPSERVHAVPSNAATTERTREMAHALSEYFKNHPDLSQEKRVNIITLGTHGRRSRIIFKEELGPDWQVGVISLPDPLDQPSKWFLRSRSAKDVLSELIALTLGLVGGN